LIAMAIITVLTEIGTHLSADFANVASNPR